MPPTAANREEQQAVLNQEGCLAALVLVDLQDRRCALTSNDRPRHARPRVDEPRVVHVTQHPCHGPHLPSERWAERRRRGGDRLRNIDVDVNGLLRNS